LERFPEDAVRGVEAEFEMALIYKKKGDLDHSLSLFKAILVKYEEPGRELLPNWPRILSEKLVITLEDAIALRSGILPEE
jgi:hypothetical protein